MSFILEHWVFIGYTLVALGFIYVIKSVFLGKGIRCSGVMKKELVRLDREIRNIESITNKRNLPHGVTVKDVWLAYANLLRAKMSIYETYIGIELEDSSSCVSATQIQALASGVQVTQQSPTLVPQPTLTPTPQPPTPTPLPARNPVFDPYIVNGAYDANAIAGAGKSMLIAFIDIERARASAGTVVPVRTDLMTWTSRRLKDFITQHYNLTV